MEPSYPAHHRVRAPTPLQLERNQLLFEGPFQRELGLAWHGDRGREPGHREDRVPMTPELSETCAQILSSCLWLHLNQEGHVSLFLSAGDLTFGAVKKLVNFPCLQALNARSTPWAFVTNDYVPSSQKLLGGEAALVRKAF